MSEDLARRLETALPRLRQRQMGRAELWRQKEMSVGIRTKGLQGLSFPAGWSLKGPARKDLAAAASYPLLPALCQGPRKAGAAAPGNRHFKSSGIDVQRMCLESIAESLLAFLEKQFRVNSFPVEEAQLRSNPGCKSWAIIHKLKVPG